MIFFLRQDFVFIFPFTTRTTARTTQLTTPTTGEIKSEIQDGGEERRKKKERNKYKPRLLLKLHTFMFLKFEKTRVSNLIHNKTTTLH
jgi:hypothetical protein